MTRHRLHLLFATCLGALALTVSLLGYANAAATLPPSPRIYFLPPAAGYIRHVVSSTLPITTPWALATSASLPDVLVMAGAPLPDSDVSMIWSTNGGKTWFPLPLPYSYVVPRTIGIVARTEASQPIRFLVGDGYKLYRSGDFGKTWAVSFEQSIPSADGICTMDLQMSQSQPGVLFLEAGCYWWPFESMSLLGSSDAIYVSVDGGVGWRKISDTPGGRLTRVMPSPSTPGRVYGSYGNQPLEAQSDDNAQNWRQLSSAWAMDSAIPDRSEPDTLYGQKLIYETTSGTVQPRLLQKTSFDNGATWRDWGANPCALPGVDGPTSYSPYASSGRQQLWVGCDDTDDSRYSDELFYSGDAGDTWRAAGAADARLFAVDFGHAGHVLMLNDSGLWRSVDGGEWMLVASDFSLRQQSTYLPAILR